MLRDIKRYTITIIGVIASIATLVGFYRDVFPDASPPAMVGLIFTGFFAVYFLLSNLHFVGKFVRHERYADGYRRLYAGIEPLHRLTRPGSNCEKKEVYQQVQGLCDSLVEAFNLVTSSPCSVCVKIVTAEVTNPTEACFETMCRNKSTSEERHAVDRHNGISHCLNNNTAFSTASGSPKGYFLSNTLPLIDGYKNTSFSHYGEPSVNPIRRVVRWPLPYRSTIVVPIKNKDDDDKTTVIGYLCVDSPNLSVFLRFDVDILLIAASALYAPLSMLKFKSPSKGQTEQ